MSATCQACGQKMPQEHRHGMNRHLVTGLQRLAEAGGVARISDLSLDRNELDNFQKLLYFDLVERVRRGVYAVTDAGYLFLLGRSHVPSWVVTYMNDVIRRSADVVGFADAFAAGNDWGYDVEGAA